MEDIIREYVIYLAYMPGPLYLEVMLEQIVVPERLLEPVGCLGQLGLGFLGLSSPAIAPFSCAQKPGQLLPIQSGSSHGIVAHHGSSFLPYGTSGRS